MSTKSKKRFLPKAGAAAVAGALLCGMFPFQAKAGTDVSLGEKSLYESVLDEYMEKIDYSEYIAQYENSKRPESSYVIGGNDYTSVEDMQVQKFENYEGMEGTSVLTAEEGSIEWTVDVKEDGLYNISVLYYPVEGKSSDIQRAVYIDGEMPFSEAATVEFDRLWGNEKAEIQVDNRGNDLKPRQVEKPAWIEEDIKDYEGYYTEPFEFYFSKGEHKIKFISAREPMLIRKITLHPAKETASYEEVLQGWKDKGYSEASGDVITVEGESAQVKSSPMLYAQTDRSSAAVTPYSVMKTKMNTIGGFNWNESGQWIEWEIEVPADGLYQIGLNVKQNWVRGFYVPRKLTIDGEVPFKEAEEIKFEYKSGWRQQYIGSNEPYLFYLSAGKHKIRLECELGGLSEIIREVEKSVNNLNTIYRKVVMLTGQDADKWRDYQVAANLPELADEIKAEYDRLTEMAAKIQSLTGKKSDKEAILLTMTKQLKLFYEDVEKIPGRKDSFKTNIGALGTWLMQAKQLPLQIDQLYIVPPGDKLPKTGSGFFNSIAHGIKSLFASFVIDYNAIGNVSEDKDARKITVWIGTGRDQANVMKSLIDESFTVNTGVNVNLMLVQMDTLLQATLSGQGPDVAMQVGNDLPMNYGMRGAVVDLTQFSDFNEVTARFRDSALVPYRFEGKCFALPETQTFNMMFYRKDILKELGLEIPQTWDDVKALMSVLSKHNMEFGMIPVITGTAQAQLTYGMFLYQTGGQFYTDDAKKSALDSDTAINAFKEWTKYYQDYTLTREFDFQSRFRTGEMPIGITDYQMYNTLQVAAPEIKGLWGFAPVPGTKKADGTIDRTIPSTGTATVIMNNAKDKEAAWEFLKWWTSSDIQTKYGREMEGLQGAAARYPTANIEALQSLPWPVEDFKNLDRQFEWVKGIPEVPGGYYTSRNLTNAFATVVIDKKVGPREALTDSVRYINDEIENKRKEFGLD